MRTIIYLLSFTLMLSGCANMSNEQKVALAGTLIKAATVSSESVAKAASLSAKAMDSKNNLAPSTNAYAKRLERIVKNYKTYDGLRLNYQVYLNDNVNAFAMPDGTVRVYKGLMDAMPDDQVLAVIGHEIGHVRLKHSYRQMKKQLLTNAAFTTLASAGGTVGQLTKSQLGQLGYAYANARFSQADELASDVYSVQFLARNNKDPKAMRRAIATLNAIAGGKQANFLSSHPSHNQRIAQIDAAISAL